MMSQTHRKNLSLPGVTDGAPRLTSLSDQVCDWLRQQIVHGQHRPGERLVEMEIAAAMGVSQGPVREALQRLENEGLVERQSRTATYVTSFSIEEMYELSVIRAQAEGFIFRRAAERITDEECDRLQQLVEGMRTAAKASDIMMLENLDRQFHQTIAELSGSRMLLRIWQPLHTQLQRFIVQAHARYFPDMREIADGHQPLVDALRTRQPKAAAAALYDHVMISWSRIGTTDKAPSKRGAGLSQKKKAAVPAGKNRSRRTLR